MFGRDQPRDSRFFLPPTDDIEFADDGETDEHAMLQRRGEPQGMWRPKGHKQRGDTLTAWVRRHLFMVVVGMVALIGVMSLLLYLQQSDAAGSALNETYVAPTGQLTQADGVAPEATLPMSESVPAAPAPAVAHEPNSAPRPTPVPAAVPPAVAHRPASVPAAAAPAVPAPVAPPAAARPASGVAPRMPTATEMAKMQRAHYESLTDKEKEEYHMLVQEAEERGKKAAAARARLLPTSKEQPEP